MSALKPEVFDAVWEAVKALFPASDRSHPLGCHRRRIPDEVCFRGLSSLAELGPFENQRFRSGGTAIGPVTYDLHVQRVATEVEVLSPAHAPKVVKTHL